MSHTIYERVLSWCKADRNRSIVSAALAVLFVSGIVMIICDYRKSVTEITDGLFRNQYGKGARTEELQVQIEGEEKAEKIQVRVSERMYTEKEIRKVFGEAVHNMDAWILGENESLDRIESDMNLIREVPGEPVDVSWELDRYDVMNVYGELNEEKLNAKGETVTLRAILTYRERESDQALYECTAVAYEKKLYGREKLLNEVQEKAKENDESSRTQSKLPLPERISGKTVRFYPAMDIRGVVFAVMAVVIFLLLYALDRQNQGKDQEKRRKQMQADYPEIINKLTLLLEAGMPVKRAWKKIISAYAENPRYGRRHAYEEMKYTYHEMSGGVAETESYERFGIRCGLPEYVRLGALLSQNLRKGTRGLNDLLRIEVANVFEERKARARRLGEEAGTKLLLPMFLMLAEVLIIVIVPAYLSVQM